MTKFLAVRRWQNAWAASVRKSALYTESYSWPAPVVMGLEGNLSPFELVLKEGSLLVGGVPGSGKSVFCSQLLSSLCLDPRVEIYGIDGKAGVELSLYRECLVSLATDLASGTALLDRLLERMEVREAGLVAMGLRKAPADWAPIVLFIDELAEMTAAGMARAKECKEFSEKLRRLLSRGRAAGIVVLAATQKPSSDVVDTSIRDLFKTRVAFRCTTPQASDTILGSGRASSGTSAADGRLRSSGVGLVLDESSDSARIFKGFFITDNEIKEVVRLSQIHRVRYDLALARAERGA